MKILVAGGGTAGLIAATILKQRFDFDVDIVRSEDIGIVGVGEGSTEHFQEFASFIRLPQYELIKNSNATLKTGVMFDGWGPKPYLHSVFNDFSERAGQYPYLYAYQIAHNSSNITAKYLWDNMVNSWFLGREEEWAAYQFHFNTYKLNEYIANFATENMGINIFDDKIVDVLLYENGYIDRVVGEKSTYDYDFYIDATGFNRLLIGKMGASWKSFGQFLKMNSAITFQTPNNEENFNVWTMAKAMNAGWMFNIPTWDHQGNGYIYDKNYIDEDSAKKEVEAALGRSIEIGKSFSFDPGHLDKVWINNCVAIGLSGSFVEPLEATSIGSSIQQAFLLSHRLPNYSDKTIDQYNKDFSGIMENIRDFIALHYIVDKGDTQFWIDNKESEIPYSLGSKLEQWVHKMPIQDDFKEYSDYALFGADNFIMVLEGLEIFNKESIKKEFYSLSKDQRDDAAQSIQNILLHNSTIKKMTHKRYIEAIREYL